MPHIRVVGDGNIIKQSDCEVHCSAIINNNILVVINSFTDEFRLYDYHGRTMTMARSEQNDGK